MKALAQALARSHRNMSGWYALAMQTPANDAKAVDVTVAREGVGLRISDRRRGQ